MYAARPASGTFELHASYLAMYSSHSAIPIFSPVLGALAVVVVVLVDFSEVERTGPTYTIETLTALRASLSSADELFFLLGQDALADMPRWKEPTRIAELARLAVAPRAASEEPPDPALAFEPPLLTLSVDMPPVGISSSDLRERVKAGRSIRYLVQADVDSYIQEKGLYRELPLL